MTKIANKRKKEHPNVNALRRLTNTSNETNQIQLQ